MFAAGFYIVATMRLRCYTQRERERETKKGKDEGVESSDVHNSDFRVFSPSVTM